MPTEPATSAGVLRFGDDFELDVRAYQLRSAGVPLKLKPIPMELLMFLIERRGELVTRQEIAERIWGKGVFLDTDNSINGAISRIRQLLREDAAQPRFVQTVTGRGYRFIAPVTGLLPSTPPSVDSLSAPGEGFVGKRVTHYRILELLGGGGMGVVHKAEDLKLGRRVAIKFLPGELARDPSALARLESEARAASALDHRNICSIYELDEHEGQPFIVMQLLKGQTLQEQMEAGSQPGAVLPLSKVLTIATQVAEGLQAAHDKGFIHRDIKPANIFITSNNEAKILDFGLAKNLEEDAEQSSGNSGHDDADSNPPSATSIQPSRLTMTGTPMGTAFYMSPEQVRGEKLDARTDIFSFGLVLYQMLSGQRAFPGKTTQVVHDSIVNGTPAPLREINPALPAKLVAIVDKCLEKERDRRYQTAAEVGAALQELERVPASVLASSRRRNIIIAGVTILVVFCAVRIWWRRPMAESAFKNYRVSALTSSGTVAFAAVSPNGRNLIFADEQGPRQSLWLQQVATSTAVRILGPVHHPLLEGVRFAPDGNYFYYIEEDPGGETQSLYRLGLTGGSPERIVFDIEDLSAVDISPDGKQLVFTRRNIAKSEYYLLTAHADGSDERRLLTVHAPETIGLPAWSPDGNNIAFGIGQGPSIRTIAVMSSQGGAERRLPPEARLISQIAWLPDQSGLLFSAWPKGGDYFSLWILSYPTGKLRRINSDLLSYFGASLTQNGRSLVTVQSEVDSNLWVAPAHDPTAATPLHEGASREDGLWGVSWLPDGRLVFGIGDLSELWVVNRDGSFRQQLTHLGKTATNPTSTRADGTIVFQRRGYESKMLAAIWAIDSHGDNLRQLTSGVGHEYRPEISPDGKWIVYASRSDCWKMTLADSKVTKLDPRGGFLPTISPDGHWIAFEAIDNHLEIVAADGRGKPRLLPFIDEPQAPSPMAAFAVTYPIRWNAAGDALTFVRTQDGVSNIWSQPIDGSPARQLTHFTSMVIWSHDWSRDGKYLVMARGNFSRDAVMLTDMR